MSVIEELEAVEKKSIKGIESQEDVEFSRKIAEMRKILSDSDPQLDEPIIIDIKVKIPEYPKEGRKEYNNNDERGFCYIYPWEIYSQMLREKPLPQTPQVIFTTNHLSKDDFAGTVISDIRITTKRKMKIKQLLGLEDEGDCYIEEEKVRDSNEPRNDFEKIEVEAFKKKIGVIKNRNKSELDEKGIFEFRDKHNNWRKVEMTLGEALISLPNQKMRSFKTYSQIQEEIRRGDEKNNRFTLSSIGRAVLERFGGERDDISKCEGERNKSVIEEIERIENDRIKEIEGQRDVKVSARIEEIMRIVRNPNPQLDEPIIMDIKVKIPEIPNDEVEHGDYFNATVIWGMDAFSSRLRECPLPQTPQVILALEELGEYECAGKVISDIRVTTKRRMQIKELLGLKDEGDNYIEEENGRESNEPRNDNEKIEVEALKEKIGIIKMNDTSELDEKGIFRFWDEYHKMREVEMTLREALISLPTREMKFYKTYSKMQEEERIKNEKTNRFTLASIGRALRSVAERLGGER